MIHVCFSLHDKTGRYSKFTGTTILSLFENTTSDVTVHILHDNTLTANNRDKFIYLAGRYGQAVKFYNVAELCAGKLADMTNLIPTIKTARVTVGAFYRLLIADLLSPDIEQVIYLDSDIVVNLDINELYQINLEQKVLGVFTSKSDNRQLNYKLCLEGLVKREDYFNSGVLLMNLAVFRNEKETVYGGLKFLSANPRLIDYYDQNVLNYCFSTRTLKLPVRFNQVVYYLRIRNKLSVRKEIYHFAGAGLNMNMGDPFNRLWMDYFLKSPWFDSSSIGRLYENVRQDQIHMKNTALNLSSTLRDKARAFMVLEKDLNSLIKNFSVRNDEEIILVKLGTPIQKIIDAINSSRNEKIFFVMLPDFPFNFLTEAGLVYGKDFVNASDFLSEEQGVSMNSYPMIQAM